jgi:hypothetical protein
MGRRRALVAWCLGGCLGAGMPAAAQAQPQPQPPPPPRAQAQPGPQAQSQAQSQAQPQSQQQPETAAQAATTQELRVVDGALPAGQRLLRARKGDALRWRITSNLPGEVHLHAYRISVALQPGRPAELAFTAHATGRFRLEWHAATRSAASAAAGSHHAPPLAVLEVHPR